MHRTLLAVAACAALGCGGSKPAAQTVPTSAPVAAPAPAPASDQVALALTGAHRSPENKARDVYRHPAETLSFFGVGPTQNVIELWPGRGWYSEILAPMLREQGKLTAVVPTGNYLQPYKDFLASQPGIYDRIALQEVSPPALSFGPDESADVVLTFRNVHGWTSNGYAAEVFAAIFKVLKPGGILGLTEHRAQPGSTIEQAKVSGYLPEDVVIGLATAAGLVLEEKSEINANPRDTKDYPKGVWTLPPSLALGDVDRAKYLEIGESDRMTLRFKKPAR
jgi:predicted methyltransferase